MDTHHSRHARAICQEPGGADEIRAFCERSYGVSFPLFEKVGVKAGERQAPVYTALAATPGQLPTWNFRKYFVWRDGKVLPFFESKVAPDDLAVKTAIETAL